MLYVEDFAALDPTWNVFIAAHWSLRGESILDVVEFWARGGGIFNGFRKNHPLNMLSGYQTASLIERLELFVDEKRYLRLDDSALDPPVLRLVHYPSENASLRWAIGNKNTAALDDGTAEYDNKVNPAPPNLQPTNSLQTQPPKKRKGQDRAFKCILCLKRERVCDLARPTCGFCTKKGKVCKYLK